MSKHHISNLKSIPVNKTVVFYSPIEGDDVLVRTGVISEGSSFFHSLLYAYSTEYVAMDKKHRTKYIHKLKASLIGKNNKENFYETSESLISVDPFGIHIADIITTVYDFLATDNVTFKGKSNRKVIKQIKNNVENIKVYKIIIDILPLDTLFSTIIPKASKQTSIDKYIKCLVKESKKYIKSTGILSKIDSKKATHIVDTLDNLLDIICKEAKDITYKEYIDGLKNIGLNADSVSIDFITSRFNRDILFIDANTRLPYNHHEFNNNRKTIILLSINNGEHYEILGRLLPGNHIQREFDITDHLVEKINLINNDPDNAILKYPELLPSNLYNDYSPRRPSKKQDDSDMSDSYYDNSDNYSSSNSSMSD
jgi:hypothetical protein